MATISPVSLHFAWKKKFMSRSTNRVEIDAVINPYGVPT